MEVMVTFLQTAHVRISGNQEKSNVEMGRLDELVFNGIAGGSAP
jgi:hypothetical protein